MLSASTAVTCSGSSSAVGWSWSGFCAAHSQHPSQSPFPTALHGPPQNTPCYSRLCHRDIVKRKKAITLNRLRYIGAAVQKILVKKGRNLFRRTSDISRTSRMSSSRRCGESTSNLSGGGMGRSRSSSVSAGRRLRACHASNASLAAVLARSDAPAAPPFVSPESFSFFPSPSPFPSSAALQTHLSIPQGVSALLASSCFKLGRASLPGTCQPAIYTMHHARTSQGSE
jgi:hypothetical protein